MQTKPHLDVLKTSTIQLLAGKPAEKLKLVYDNTSRTQEAIAFYANEVKGLKTNNPTICLHFVKLLQNFWTPAQVKQYAAQTTELFGASYSFWKQKRDDLQAIADTA